MSDLDFKERVLDESADAEHVDTNIDYDAELAIAYQKIGELEYQLNHRNDNNSTGAGVVTDIITFQSENSQNPVVINDILFDMDSMKQKLISLGPFVTYPPSNSVDKTVTIRECQESSEYIYDVISIYTSLNDKLIELIPTLTVGLEIDRVSSNSDESSKSSKVSVTSSSSSCPSTQTDDSFRNDFDDDLIGVPVDGMDLIISDASPSTTPLSSKVNESIQTVYSSRSSSCKSGRDDDRKEQGHGTADNVVESGVGDDNFNEEAVKTLRETITSLQDILVNKEQEIAECNNSLLAMKSMDEELLLMKRENKALLHYKEGIQLEMNMLVEEFSKLDSAKKQLESELATESEKVKCWLFNGVLYSVICLISICSMKTRGVSGKSNWMPLRKKKCFLNFV